MFDCHFHLDESMVSLPGLLASMDAAGIEKTALIPSLCPPLELPPLAEFVLPLYLRAIHRTRGLLHRGAVALYKSQVKPDNLVNLMGREYEIKVQPRNDEVINAVRRYPERFVGYIFVNPVGPVDPLAEIERCLSTPGMIGVKAHPYWHNYALAYLRDVAALCAERGLPLLIHLGAEKNGDYKLLPEHFPALKIIYAHTGIPYSPLVCDYAREKKNVWVDLSSTSYVDLRAARAAIRRAGTDKCLFGTDGPYFHAAHDRFDFNPSLRILHDLHLMEEDRERVCRRNFGEICGIL